MLPDEKIKEILLSESYVSQEDLDKANDFAGAHHTSFLEYLYEQNIANTATVGQALAEYYHLPYADLESPDKELINKIPEEIAAKFRIVFVKEVDKDIHIATDNPEQSGLQEELKKIFPDQNIILCYANTTDIEKCFSLYRKELSTRFGEILKSGKAVAPELLNEIFEDAVSHHASDIHFEPQESDAKIRFRIDGVLIEAGNLGKDHYNNILNLIKVMANARIDDHFSAQDGSIRHEGRDTIIDMRVSIVPTVNGEKVTIRLLAHYVKGFGLEDIGLSQDHQQQITKAAKKPFGMILVVGPTGSGKTTTLYSLLKILNNPEVNITTIEDPVEYRIPGVNQIQVNTKTNLSFAEGLRSIVRQDPDVILVGEIRDNETAEISVNAALTGHLVLSTFHANDAASTFPRLLDMKIENYLLASTLQLIIAQRLIRKICSSCRHSEEVHINDLWQLLPNPTKYFDKEVVTLYRGKGCKACNGTGFQGRTGVYELLTITKEMQDLLVKNPSAAEISAKSREQGGSFMFDDGLQKVITGVTTIDELVRVINPSE